MERDLGVSEPVLQFQDPKLSNVGGIGYCGAIWIGHDYTRHRGRTVCIDRWYT